MDGEDHDPLREQALMFDGGLIERQSIEVSGRLVGEIVCIHFGLF